MLFKWCYTCWNSELGMKNILFLVNVNKGNVVVAKN